MDWKGVAFLGVFLASAGSAHSAPATLPEGPIRDRHELMERIGKQAKTIGDALKKGQLDPVGPAAGKIAEEAARALPLFPPGSTHPKSRAKPEIWQHWEEFEKTMKQLEMDARATVTASETRGDVRKAADQMFRNCKSCHDRFRLPEKP